jgi:sec-independent protein translocase protein TatB
MLNIGMTELLVFGIIALLVLGPEKLPEGARFAGKWYGKMKRMVSNVQNDIDRELRMSEFKEQMQNEMKRIQELEEKMKAQMQDIQRNQISDHVVENPSLQRTVNIKTAQKNQIYTYIQHSDRLTIPCVQQNTQSDTLMQVKKTDIKPQHFSALAEAV